MNRQELGIIGVNLAIYAAYFTGIFLAARENFAAAAAALVLRKRLRPSGGRAHRLPAPAAYFARALGAVFKKEVNGFAFFFGTVALFAAALLIGLRMFSPASALACASMAAAMPVMAVFLRLESERTKSSAEALSFVTELYRQYRISKCNIYAAMEAAASSSGDFPVCRRHLHSLLMRLRGSGDAADIKAYADSFAFALGTVWGRMLSVCIRMAALNGTDISAGLADMIEQLKAANARAEERKRMNGESLRMTLFLVPLLYAATLLLSVFYLDVSPMRLLGNQFATAEGLLFFMLIAFLSLLNTVILRAVANTRIDY